MTQIGVLMRLILRPLIGADNNEEPEMHTILTTCDRASVTHVVGRLQNPKGIVTMFRANQVPDTVVERGADVCEI